MSSAARNEATLYHRRGWCPIPVKERSKATSLVQLAPYLKRRATKEELNAWTWNGVGIVTGGLSGLLVLDVDGERGEEKLKELGHPVTPMVRTAGGGLHLYFKHPGENVRTGIRVAPELDVKGAGGYVVAPPSLGANGRRYEWIISPEEAELADPPEWIMRLLERPRRSGAAPPVGKKIPPGSRNQELASIAGTMRRRGMEEPEILAALRTANELRCEPPLEAAEVEKIAASVARYEPASSSAAAGAGDVVHVSFNGRQRPGDVRGGPSFNLTDLGNAERFVADHGEDVRYCYPWGKWLVWSGLRWERDDSGRVHRLAKETVRGIYREAAEAEEDQRRKELAKHATRSEAEAKIRAMLELAKSELPVSPDELDGDPWLLGAENGTVDLQRGELREHRREDLITKLAPVTYDPDAEAPAWERFLERVLPSEDLRAFVRRAVGYSATGDTSEQVMFINHGAGNNGKSTFQEALAAALGDYAMRAPTEMLMAKRSSGVPNDIARLKGARFVSASETEEGRRLAESLVKDLTGQDTISARFMRAEFFDFRPTHKLWLSTNHKPEIRGTDNAIWRRIRLVPWTVAIPPAERDRKLPERLRSELPGILSWIVRGCLEWHRVGLRAPNEVRRATIEYRAEMDVLAGFLEECCVVDERGRSYSRELYAAYKRWSEDSGERPESQKRLAGRLSERGFLNDRDSRTGRKMWSGLSLKDEWRARTEGSLNLPNTGFAGDFEGTEGSEPKNNINARENTSRGVISKKGSDPSEGSAAEDFEDLRGIFETGDGAVE